MRKCSIQINGKHMPRVFENRVLRIIEPMKDEEKEKLGGGTAN
jgi:hypothetical protein